MPASLDECLRSRGAVFGDGAAGRRVLNFGNWQAEYEALSAAAAIVDLSARTRIELMGRDRASFLHNLSTNDIRKLAAGAGCEAFLLDARGHVLGHVFVICRAESLLLETVAGQEERLLEHLDRYLIREQVELVGRTAAWGELLLAGPQAAALLSRLASGPWPAAALSSVETELAGCSATIVRTALIQPEGFHILCAAGDVAAVWQALADVGAQACGWQAFDAARVEAGFPFYGADISDKNLPQEVGRNRQAISFVKGCYIGQETVARIDALGHVNRLLVGVRFEGSRVPDAGSQLSCGDQVVGQVTSAVFSPRLQAPLASAYVRRGHEAPGSALSSSHGAAAVINLPV